MAARRSRGLLILAFASIYLVWGSTYLAIRVGVTDFPPTLLAGIRFAVAGAGMLLALTVAGRRPRVAARDLRVLAVIAALLLLGGNGLLVWAEQHVTSGLAALIVATVPLWMAGIATLPPLRERPSLAAVLGLVLGFVGVAILMRPALGRPGGEASGMLAVALGSLSWSCGSLYARHAALRIDPLIATAWEMLLGGLMFLALAALTGARVDPDASPGAIGALIYLIVFGSWIAFTAYVYLLANVPAAKVATYAYVNPVIAVLLGWWLLDEPITPSVVGGSVLIVVAVVLVTWPRVQPAAEDRALAPSPVAEST